MNENNEKYNFLSVKDVFIQNYNISTVKKNKKILNSKNHSFKWNKINRLLI